MAHAVPVDDAPSGAAEAGVGEAAREGRCPRCGAAVEIQFGTLAGPGAAARAAIARCCRDCDWWEEGGVS